jgi:hypothetical protein
MAKPTIQGREIRLQRREDGRLYTADFIAPEVTPPLPPPALEGPYLAGVVGDLTVGSTVAIKSDGVNSFGTAIGQVLIGNARDFVNCTNLEPLTIQAWSSTQINATISLASFNNGNDGAMTDRMFLFVRNSDNQVVLYGGIPSRRVTHTRTRVGGNTSLQYRAGVQPQLRNWAQAMWLGANWQWVENRNKPAGHVFNQLFVITSFGWPNTQFTTNGPAYAGRYVFQWEGSARIGIGFSTSNVSSGPRIYFDVTETQAEVWFCLRNNTDSTMELFLRNPIIVKIDDYPGATDAEKADAAIADWQAGFAAKDERLFHPALLQAWQEMNLKGVRFLDWGDGQRSYYYPWESRKPYNAMMWGISDGENVGGVNSQSPDGTYSHHYPLEVQFAFARAVNADSMHLCIPYLVDEPWLVNFAGFIQSEYGAQLLAGKKLYVEIGNEWWNWATPWGIGRGIGISKWHDGNLPKRVEMTAGSDVMYSPNHGLSEGTDFYIMALSAHHPFRGYHAYPPHGSFEVQAYDVTQDTFKIRRKLNPDDLAPPAPNTGVMWIIESPLDSGTLPGIAAQMKSSVFMYKIFKENLPPAMYANVVKFWATSASTAVWGGDDTNATEIDWRLQRWYSHGAEIGFTDHIEEVSVAPYLYGYTSPTFDEMKQRIIDRREWRPQGPKPWDGNSLLQWERAFVLPNRPWSGQALKLSFYEFGFHDTTSPSELPFSIYSEQGSDAFEYWLNHCTASGLVTDAYFYTAYRDQSAWALREYVTKPSLLSSRIAAWNNREGA